MLVVRTTRSGGSPLPRGLPLRPGGAEARRPSGRASASAQTQQHVAPTAALLLRHEAAVRRQRSSSSNPTTPPATSNALAIPGEASALPRRGAARACGREQQRGAAVAGDCFDERPSRRRCRIAYASSTVTARRAVRAGRLAHRRAIQQSAGRGGTLETCPFHKRPGAVLRPAFALMQLQ